MVSPTALRLIIIDLEKLLAYVEEDSPLLEKRKGICSNIYKSNTAEVISLFKSTYPKWPEFSGDFIYPVPCPYGYDPKEIYHETKDKWAGAYGESRKSLLKFLLTSFTNLLEELTCNSKENL